jgi:hypothetical protein
VIDKSDFAFVVSKTPNYVTRKLFSDCLNADTGAFGNPMNLAKDPNTNKIKLESR